MKKEVFTLIMDKEEEKIIELMKCDEFDVSWEDNNGNNLLIQVIRYGLPKIFTKLVNLGVNIDSPNGYGNTPLMWAIKEREFKMFSQILEKNPNLSLRNKENYTAIDFLLDCDDKNILESFILSIDSRKSLSLLESQVLHTNHQFYDYTMELINIVKLQFKLNHSLSDKSTIEKKESYINEYNRGKKLKI